MVKFNIVVCSKLLDQISHIAHKVLKDFAE